MSRKVGAIQVSEDGRHTLYLEVQDFDRAKCNAFVQSIVWAQLGQHPDAVINKADLPARLREWFATLPRNFTLACDSQYDQDLLSGVLGGEWPPNFSGWFDLRALADTIPYFMAETRYHTPDCPEHHAFNDAYAHRAGWLACRTWGVKPD